MSGAQCNFVCAHRRKDSQVMGLFVTEYSRNHRKGILDDREESCTLH